MTLTKLIERDLAILAKKKGFDLNITGRYYALRPNTEGIFNLVDVTQLRYDLDSSAGNRFYKDGNFAYVCSLDDLKNWLLVKHNLLIEINCIDLDEFTISVKDILKMNDLTTYSVDNFKNRLLFIERYQYVLTLALEYAMMRLPNVLEFEYTK